MDLKELGSVTPEVHWYYTSKLAVVLKMIRGVGLSNCPILDVGAGSGFFAGRIGTAINATSVICYDPNYKDFQVGERGNISFRRALSEEEYRVAELTLILDVLEHVPNDFAFLSEIVKRARENSTFVITVPAFMGLWGGHDEFLGHLRRYRLSELKELVEDSGLIVTRGRYLFRIIFPIVWVVRKIRKRSIRGDLTPMSPAVNSVLRAICTIDNLLSGVALPGVSAIVVARKPAVTECKPHTTT